MIAFLLGCAVGSLAGMVTLFFVLRAAFARHWHVLLGDDRYTLTVRREIRETFWL